MGRESWVVLGGHLKKTLKKFKLLRQRHLGSITGYASYRRRRLSFDARLAAFHGYNEDEQFIGNCYSVTAIQRACSYASDDDIDKRAEIFIADFHRQLRLERE
jgi:hypothetical protein